MSAVDPAQWEKDTVDALEEMLGRLRYTADEVDVSEIRLEGSYPHTRVVARHTPRGGPARTSSYKLWRSAFLGPDGDWTPPGNAALLLYTWISGG